MPTIELHGCFLKATSRRPYCSIFWPTYNLEPFKKESFLLFPGEIGTLWVLTSQRITHVYLIMLPVFLSNGSTCALFPTSALVPDTFYQSVIPVPLRHSPFTFLCSAAMQ